MADRNTQKAVNPKVMRKQLFVDPKVQGALVIRAVVYWVACIVTISLMLLCWRILTGPARPLFTHFDDMWFFYGPAIIASLLLLPMVVADIIRLSNRFAGPMLRLRRSMRALARGEHVSPIEFRDSDFWQDFAEEFNQLLVRVQGPESVLDDESPATDGITAAGITAAGTPKEKEAAATGV
ncbi:MAG: hypothetical protein U1E05_08485 [Patescibacteria group bacterium]|nr:hypothetical protein [Patescibacteria group bacterium]